MLINITIYLMINIMNTFLMYFSNIILSKHIIYVLFKNYGKYFLGMYTLAFY